MSPASRALLRRALRIAGSVGLLIATALWVDVGAVVSELKAARLGPLVLALALSLPLMATLASRWSFTARRLGLDMPVRVAVAEYYASTFLNRVLPGGVLGDVGRAVRGGRRYPDAKGAAARSVVLERLSGQVALWVFVVAGLVRWGAEEGRRVAMVTGVLVSLLVLLGVLLAVALPRVPGFSRSRVGEAWALVAKETRLAFLDRGAWAVQLGLSLLSVVFLVAIYAACADAVGVRVSFAQLMFIAPVLLAVSTLPVSVGGWGIREVTSVALFEMTGLEPAAGVAASAAFGAVNLVGALPGIAVLLRRNPTPT